MSTHLARTQIALCLCMNAPFTETNLNESTDQGALVRVIHACVLRKRLFERLRNWLNQPQGRLKESFQFVPIQP